jgi:hypothetical protein
MEDSQDNIVPQRQASVRKQLGNKGGSGSRVSKFVNRGGAKGGRKNENDGGENLVGSKRGVDGEIV